MELYLTIPTDFIINFYNKLLPAWQKSPQSIGIFLLPASLSLAGESSEIEVEKIRLLKQFLEWGEKFYLTCEKNKIKAEIISPQDGFPIYSDRGDINFDIVKVVAELLKFQTIKIDRCKAIVHPQWQTAVYPGLLLSTSLPSEIKCILANIWELSI
jgi:hypothetical protein